MSAKQTSRQAGNDATNSVAGRPRWLSAVDLKNLSLETSILGGQRPAKLTNQSTNKSADQTVSTSAGSRAGQMKRWKWLWLAAGGLLLLSLLVTRGSGSGAGRPPADPPPQVSPTPVTLDSLSMIPVEQTWQDSDGDSIPDQLETILGYNPQANDCVREIGCGDFPTLPRAKLRVNLLFIVDASGSMNKQLDTGSKWQSAIEALNQTFVQGFPNFVEAGILLYGHQGSASEQDKAVSCAGIELAQPLTAWRQIEVTDLLKNYQPTGWTPLAAALQKAGVILGAREGEANFVVIVSDGIETCGGDPIAEARALQTSGVQVTTNVVGLAVKPAEQQQLQAIAQAGGGQYFPARSSGELRQAVQLSAEAIRLWEEVNQCILQHLSDYGQCITVQYLQVLNYIKQWKLSQQQQLNNNKIAPEYIDMEKRIWDKYQQLNQDNWNKYYQDLQKLKLTE